MSLVRLALMGALILAARRSPVEAVAAVLSTYWDEEQERAATFAVCEFIAHVSR